MVLSLPFRGGGPTVSAEAEVPEVPLARAITQGLRDALAADERVLVMGEDVGRLGGVFTVTQGLLDEFGGRRVIDTPLSEGGIVGTAIGLALAGFRPVCEIQFDGFIFPGFDQITSQLARLRSRYQGGVMMPVVIRVPYGGGIGAVEHHQESPESYFAHTPGLRVVAPSTPQDAYGMIRAAIECDDPVLFFEPKRRYWVKGAVAADVVVPPLDRATVCRRGDRLTLAGWGAMVDVLLEAAEAAAEQGVAVEVIDVRSISPLDVATVVESVRKTGRLIVVQEAPGSTSVASELAARVAEEAFFDLEAPVVRVAGFDVPFPPSRLEDFFVPDADRVLEAMDRSLSYG